jgi:Arc/MetJ-type ribon-helix-helix transcriptional regulator
LLSRSRHLHPGADELFLIAGRRADNEAKLGATGREAISRTQGPKSLWHGSYFYCGESIASPDHERLANFNKLSELADRSVGGTEASGPDRAKPKRQEPGQRLRRRPAIPIPSIWMAYGVLSVVERGKPGESEKITINLGAIDLGQIDLLVQEGFYSNRTDFIRTAIRNQLTTHADALKQTVARKQLVLGLQHYSRQDLEALHAAGERLQIQVLGLASIAHDVSAELARATIESVTVLGLLQASRDVKAALADRMR